MRHMVLVLGWIAVLVTSSCRVATDRPTATAPVTPDTYKSSVQQPGRGREVPNRNAVDTAKSSVQQSGRRQKGLDRGPVDTSKSGVYRSGLWEYRYSVSLAGTKSEGYYGKLLFRGKPAPAASGLNDYYRTPWGKLYWVSQRMVPFGGHGWMPRAMPSSPAGKQLPDPAALVERPVIMALALATGDAVGGVQPKIRGWVGDELKKLKVTKVHLERDWFRLTDRAVTIHDTKMLGRLTVRLADPRDENTLTVILGGSRAVQVRIPRKDGATKLVRYRLSSAVGEATFYLAFRVKRAALGGPKAMEIGPEANSKTVKVKGVSRIIIRLPGNRNSGFAWEVAAVEGKAVKVAGRVRYAPDATAQDGSAGAHGPPLGMSGLLRELQGGTYEAHFRVIGKGKSTVQLSYHGLRLGPAKKPPEKTFRVTLEVQDVPVSAAAFSTEEKR